MKRALVLFTFVALAACSSDDTKTVVVTADGGGVDAGPVTPAGCIRGTGQSTSQTVGHGGANITLDGFAMHIEPDAIANDTKVTVTSSVACPGETTLASETPIYEITPAGLALSIPAGISITYGGGSHGAMLFATTTQGDLGYIATSAERNEVHGSISALGAVWVAAYPALGPTAASFVPPTNDPTRSSSTLLLVSDNAQLVTKDCSCSGPHTLGAPTPLSWVFVFDAAKQDYFPRAAVSITESGNYSVMCPTAGFNGDPILGIDSTVPVTFTASPTTLTWSAPGFVKCVVDGADAAASGSTGATKGTHTLICYDSNGVRVSRWVQIAG